MNIGNRGLALLRGGFAFFATSVLAACVFSEKPLLTKTEPLVGDHFSVTIYDAFRNGKAHNVQVRRYDWIDGHYVAAVSTSGSNTRLEAARLGENNLLVQRSDANATLVTYWIARPVLDGAYVVSPIDEADLSANDRARLCSSGDFQGLCRVDSYDALLIIAKASASATATRSALAVLQSDTTQQRRLPCLDRP